MPADQQPLPPNLREAVEIVAAALYKDSCEGCLDCRTWTEMKEDHGLEYEGVARFYRRSTAALRALLAQEWSVTPPQPVRTRPTIAELEAILAQPDDNYAVHINPDGSISAVEKPTIHSLDALDENAPSAPVGAADGQ